MRHVDGNIKRFILDLGLFQNSYFGFPFSVTGCFVDISVALHTVSMCSYVTPLLHASYTY